MSLAQLERLEIDSDAHAAAAYALRAWLSGEACEAAWAARRAYECRDEIAANELDVRVYTPEVETNTLSRPIVQSELEAQARDLAAVESGNYLDVIKNGRRDG
jgi:hypothetical protein